MKERISKLIEQKKLTHAQFADLIDVQPSSISHILSGRNKPSLDFIQKVLSNFKEINSDWLILGKGAMFRQPTQAGLFEASSLQENNKTKKDAPKIPPTQKKNGKEKIKKQEISTPTIETSKAVKQDSKQQPQENNFANQATTTITNNAQEIERIVIFYTNKQFIEYMPG